jgi:hypothetical protein
MLGLLHLKAVVRFKAVTNSENIPVAWKGRFDG